MSYFFGTIIVILIIIIMAKLDDSIRKKELCEIENAPSGTLRVWRTQPFISWEREDMIDDELAKRDRRKVNKEFVKSFTKFLQEKK